jgi:hypothetical protein
MDDVKAGALVYLRASPTVKAELCLDRLDQADASALKREVFHMRYHFRDPGFAEEFIAIGGVDSLLTILLDHTEGSNIQAYALTAIRCLMSFYSGLNRFLESPELVDRVRICCCCCCGVYVCVCVCVCVCVSPPVYFCVGGVCFVYLCVVGRCTQTSFFLSLCFFRCGFRNNAFFFFFVLLLFCSASFFVLLLLLVVVVVVVVVVLHWDPIQLFYLVDERVLSSVSRQAIELLFVLCNWEGGFSIVHKAAKFTARMRGIPPYANLVRLIDGGDFDTQLNALTLLNRCVLSLSLSLDLSLSLLTSLSLLCYLCSRPFVDFPLSLLCYLCSRLFVDFPLRTFVCYVYVGYVCYVCCCYCV